jgi:hypothetical protein
MASARAEAAGERGRAQLLQALAASTQAELEGLQVGALAGARLTGAGGPPGQPAGRT